MLEIKHVLKCFLEEESNVIRDFSWRFVFLHFHFETVAMRSYLGSSQVHNSKDVSAFEASLTDLATNISPVLKAMAVPYVPNRNWGLRCCR